MAQVCDRLWLVPATDRSFAYITYMSPPHVALVCSGPPQKRGHLWLNKVASVLGPLKLKVHAIRLEQPVGTKRLATTLRGGFTPACINDTETPPPYVFTP